jgi:hypothetical protein
LQQFHLLEKSPGQFQKGRDSQLTKAKSREKLINRNYQQKQGISRKADRKAAEDQVKEERTNRDSRLFQYF